MERPFYEAEEDRTNLVPSLQQDAPWVQVPDASAGVEPNYPEPPYNSPFTAGFVHYLDGTIHGQASTPHGTSPYPYPNADGATAIYDARHSYHAIGSNIMSLGVPDVHDTPANQGQGLHLTSNPYLASTIEEFAPLYEYGATSATCGATNEAYGDASAAYGDINAAYAAGTNTVYLSRGIWPPTDPVSTLMGYDYGVADINPSVCSLVHNPTLAPGNLTTTPVQVGYESNVTNPEGSRPQCSTCNTTFKRASDLARHQKKHQARRAFKCLVPGCNFKGSYRKDKLDAHVRSCHPRGAA